MTTSVTNIKHLVVKLINNIHVCFADLMAKVNASPKKKVQAKLNTTGQLMAPPADPSVNAPRKFSGFTGRMLSSLLVLKASTGRKELKSGPTQQIYFDLPS